MSLFLALKGDSEKQRKTNCCHVKEQERATTPLNIHERKQRMKIKNWAQKNKKGNFTRSNIEKYGIAINLIASKLFGILGAPILFSLTIYPSL